MMGCDTLDAGGHAVWRIVKILGVRTKDAVAMRAPSNRSTQFSTHNSQIPDRNIEITQRVIPAIAKPRPDL